MGIPSVLSAWLSGYVASNGNLTCVSGKLFSYQEQIALMESRLGVVYVLAPKRRSKTTMRHRTAAQRAASAAGYRLIVLSETDSVSHKA